MNITKQQYLQNPCGESSLPYWKAIRMDVPDNMLIQHDRHFCGECLTDYIDEPYFRLYHDLKTLRAAILPDGFRLCEASPSEYAAHINSCYADISVTEAEVQSYSRHSVYSADLWIAVQACNSEEIVATGIAEFDAQVGEGIGMDSGFPGIQRAWTRNLCRHRASDPPGQKGAICDRFRPDQQPVPPRKPVSKMRLSGK